MKLKLNKIMQKFNQVLSHTIAEVFIVLGFLLIIGATFMINIIAGIYLSGIILILCGLFIASNRK